MRVAVGDIRIFVEVVGNKLSTEGGAVSERPTIVFCHGGPAWDHLTLLPDFEKLADIAQLIFYDHRGLGRSDIASASTWNLAQWAADLKGLLDTLGIERPVVFGQSFGGMVVQQFALDYPDAYSGLVLSSTVPYFDLDGISENISTLVGEEGGRLTRAFFSSNATADEKRQFLAKVTPFYTTTRRAIGVYSPYIPDVTDHYFSESGDGRRFDFRSRLHHIRAPTLVIGGDSDPVTMAGSVREMADLFTPGVASLKIFEHCGHGPARDCPEETLETIRTFVTKQVAGAAV